MNNKYELLITDTKIIDNKTLYRIKALRDIPSNDVKVGDLGGYIESEDNLPQEDNSWVYENGVIAGDCKISGESTINCLLTKSVKISGEVYILDPYCMIKNSSIRGKMVIDGGVVIDRSIIECEGRLTTGMFISNSKLTLSNLENIGEADIIDCIIDQGSMILYPFSRIENCKGGVDIKISQGSILENLIFIDIPDINLPADTYLSNTIINKGDLVLHTMVTDLIISYTPKTGLFHFNGANFTESSIEEYIGESKYIELAVDYLCKLDKLIEESKNRPCMVY